MPHEGAVVADRNLTYAPHKLDENSNPFALCIEQVGTFRQGESFENGATAGIAGGCVA
jgi:hypothetical protein